MEANPDQKVQDDATPRKRKRSPNSDLHPITDRKSRIQDNAVRWTPEEAAAQSSSKRLREKSGSPKITGDIPEAYQMEHTHTYSLVDLPVGILQNILCHVDPFSLGRLMCVNKYLCSLLDSLQELHDMPGSSTVLHRLKPESIWSCSRKAYLPGIPHPLASMTEYDMMKLTYGKRCQRCGKQQPKPSSSNSVATPWNSGPGPTGVRTIWPFRTRLCADCLWPLLLKESDLNQPGSPQLHLGLLSASFTPSLHYVMSITLTQTPVPVNLQLTKYYYRPQVEQLRLNAPEPLVIGSPAYETFVQTLDAMRQEAVTDTVRLEAWELSLKTASEMLTVPSNTMIRSSASGSSVQSDNVTKSYFSTSSGGQRPYTTMSSRSGIGSSLMSGQLSRNDIGPQSYLSRTSENMTAQAQFATTRSLLPIPQFRKFNHVAYTPSDQGSVDIVRLKAERRGEIQRRCMILDPPITAQVLERLPAFQSAVQSLMPLDDAAWQRLKAQLLDEGSGLGISDVPDLDAAPTSPGHVDTASTWRAPTPVAEPLEVDFKQQAVRPVREKLYEFAREYVHRRYADGTGLTHSTAPQFAADVLLYVRHRFYENQRFEDAAFREQNRHPPDEGPSGIRTRTLKLEHMRYVFDTSIKPFTEFVRKDLFLCSACDTQGRHFALEAIIQHYASKHTDTFSRGSAVVYWKAEWPAQPPFEPRPGKDIDPAARTTYGLSTPQVSAPSVARGLNQSPLGHDSSHASYSDRGGVSTNQTPGLLHNISVMDEASQSESRDFHTSIEWPRDRLDQPLERFGRDTYINPTHRIGNPNTDGLHLAPYPAASFMDPSEVVSRRHYQRRVSPVAYDSDYQARTEGDTYMVGGDARQTELHTGVRPLYSGRYSYHQQGAPVFAEGSEMQRGRSYDSYRDDRHRNMDVSLLSESRASPQPRSPPQHRQHYNPSRHQIMAPIDHYSRDEHINWDHSVDTISTSERNAAERFLASVDMPTASGDIKYSPKPASTGRLSRPASREHSHSREALVGRRSNTSQHRSHLHFLQSADDQDSTIAPAASRFDDQAFRRRSSFSGPSISYQASGQHRGFVPAEREPYQVEYVAEIVENPRYARNYDPRLRPDEGGHRDHYDLQRPRYLDRYGRELDPRNLEIIHDPRNYQEVRAVRLEPLYYPSDGPEGYGRNDNASSEQSDPALGPADRRSYIGGATREYLPRQRYIEYEQLPAREIIYDDELRYHHPNHPPHRSDEERYRQYERH